MLAVVQHHEQIAPRQAAEGIVGETHRGRERAAHRVGGGHLRQLGDHHAVPVGVGRLGGGLVGESRLADAARAEEREEAGSAQPRPHLIDLPAMPHEARGLERDARAVERGERGKIRPQPHRHDLDQPLGPQQIAEPVVA